VKVIHGLESDELPLRQCALTVGNFDGVHRGHQRIIASVRELAKRLGGPAVVLTFEPHPLSVVSPGGAPARLMPLGEKVRCLADAGADVAVVAHADRVLLSLTAEEFVDRIVERFGPKYLVEGPTFGFGRGRTGDPDTLRRLSPRFGFEVCVVEPVTMMVEGGDRVSVSSSLIRRLVSEGLVDEAAAALGRRYAVLGPVEHGLHRGATLGYPTVNVAVRDQLVPADGVYAGWARLPDRSPTAAGEARHWAAAVSIGSTPTFPGSHGPNERKVEAYLLDTDADLYGREFRLEFGVWLREQQKFESPEALSAQISRDVEAVRRYAASDGAKPVSPGQDR
jgi:riboflavin kinase/FMN adenylyltransferase